jgi:hypothetical protein
MVVGRLQQSESVYLDCSRRLLYDSDMAFGGLGEPFIPVGSILFEVCHSCDLWFTGQQRRGSIGHRALAFLVRVPSPSLVVSGHSRGLGIEMETDTTAARSGRYQ